MEIEIVAHIALGLLLTSLVWAIGLAIVFRLGAVADPLFVLLAYPFGLLFTAIWSFLYLVNGWLSVIGLAVALTLLLDLRRYRADLGRFTCAISAPVRFALPFATALSVLSAIVMHGPGPNRASDVGGDLMFFVSRAFSAQVSVFPWRSLVVAGEHYTQNWLQSADPLMTAAAAGALHADVFLFNATSILLFVTISVAICFATIGRQVEDRWAPSSWPWVAPLVLVVISWPPLGFGGTSPVGLVFPMAFSLYLLVYRRMPWVMFLMVVAVTAICMALTMVVGLAAVAIAAALGVARYRYWRDLRPAWRLGAATSLAGLALCFALLLLPEFSIAKPVIGFDPARNPPTFRNLSSEDGWRQFAPILRATAEALVLLALLRVRAWASLVMLSMSLLFIWVVFVHDFGVVLLVSLVFCSLLFLERTVFDRLATTALVAGGAIMSVATWLDGSPTLRLGFFGQGLFMIAIAGSLLAAVAPRLPVSRGGISVIAVGTGAVGVIAAADRPLLGLAVAAALVALVSLVNGSHRGSVLIRSAALATVVLGAAVLAVRAAQSDNFRITQQIRGRLSPDDYHVWQAVRRLVPRGALVFTDALNNDRFRGFYFAAGHRQVYLGTSEYSYIKDDPSRLAARVAGNREVLDGKLAPSRAPGADGYSAYFAVRNKDAPRPRGSRVLFTNATYVLMRLRD